PRRPARTARNGRLNREAAASPRTPPPPPAPSPWAVRTAASDTFLCHGPATLAGRPMQEKHSMPIRRPIPPLCAATLLAAACTLGAHAQQADSAAAGNAGAPPTLPALTVTDTEPGSLTVPGIGQQRDAVRQTPGSVGFIDNAALLDRYQANLRDVLQDA